MAANYHDVLEQLQAAGLQVTALEPGRMRRCRVEGDREKRGWYVLHELPLPNGDLVLVGTFGVWRGNDNGLQKVDLRKRDKEFSVEQRESLRRRLAEDRKRVERERRDQAERAAQRATAAWSKLSEAGDSEYLANKHVSALGLSCRCSMHSARCTACSSSDPPSRRKPPSARPRSTGLQAWPSRASST